MLIAFYAVNNRLNYGRHEFDNIYDNPEEILERLSKLGDEELRIYDMSRILDIYDFQEDYNDEMLDGGWWCVVIGDTK